MNAQDRWNSRIDFRRLLDAPDTTEDMIIERIKSLKSDAAKEIFKENGLSREVHKYPDAFKTLIKRFKNNDGVITIILLRIGDVLEEKDIDFIIASLSDKIKFMISNNILICKNISIASREELIKHMLRMELPGYEGMGILKINNSLSLSRWDKGLRTLAFQVMLDEVNNKNQGAEHILQFLKSTTSPLIIAELKQLESHISMAIFSVTKDPAFLPISLKKAFLIPEKNNGNI